MSKRFQIDKHVPLPERSNLPPLPLNDMEIGDSFLLDTPGKNDKSALRARLWRYQNNNQPKRFSMIREADNEQVRIHRTHDFGCVYSHKLDNSPCIGKERCME